MPVSTRSGSAKSEAAARSRGRPTRKARISSCERKKRAVSLADRNALRAINASMATRPASQRSVECRNSLIASGEPYLPVRDSGWQRRQARCRRQGAARRANQPIIKAVSAHYQNSVREKQQADGERPIRGAKTTP